MNRKDFKRYKKINNEIANLHQDVDDILNEIKRNYTRRDLKEIKNLEATLSSVLWSLNTRETIREELLLPKYLKIEGGFQDIQDFIKENDWNEEETQELLEEYCSTFMLDSYNHNHFDFYYYVKGKDIYINNIRWNKNQILPNDIKMVLKGKKRIIKNDFVEVTKSKVFKGSLIIKYENSKTFQSANLKEAIRFLEDNYYM